METIESNTPLSPVAPNANSPVDFINPQRPRSSFEEYSDSSLETLEDPLQTSCFACFSGIFQSFLDWIGSLCGGLFSQITATSEERVNPCMERINQEIELWKRTCESDLTESHYPNKTVMKIEIRAESSPNYRFEHHAHYDQKDSHINQIFGLIDQAQRTAITFLESHPILNIKMVFCVISKNQEITGGETSLFDVLLIDKVIDSNGTSTGIPQMFEKLPIEGLRVLCNSTLSMGIENLVSSDDSDADLARSSSTDWTLAPR